MDVYHSHSLKFRACSDTHTVTVCFYTYKSDFVGPVVNRTATNIELDADFISNEIALNELTSFISPLPGVATGDDKHYCT